MRIKELRKKANMTQEQLAEHIGTQQTTISSWEMGIQEPRANTLLRIARALGCSIEELFDEEELYGCKSIKRRRGV